MYYLNTFDSKHQKKCNCGHKCQKKMSSLAKNALFESIARCTKRQISRIIIDNQRAERLNTYERQFGPQTNFYVVEFVYNSRIFPFAVTATQIQK